MKISYNWLKEHIDLKEKPEKVADILTMHAFEVEGIEKFGKDYILDVDILPNRAHDCLSHIGVARELEALLKRKINFKLPKIKEDKKLKISDYISVNVKDAKLCPRYTARVVLNVKVGPSPKWLKDKLEALGQNSINNVVDAANFVMLLMGQPLHAFDLDKIENGKIIIAKAKDKETIKTLGGEKYILDNAVLTIRDNKDALAIVGIKGGVKAEIDKSTKNIILESAYFEPKNIRKTSKKLNLRTESSLRFENEVSPILCRKSLDVIVDVVLNVAGGNVVSGVIDTADKKYEKTKVIFSTKDIRDIIGIEISDKDILSILKRLNFLVSKSNKKDILIAEVPFERLDITLKEDLADEVARIYGYENIKAKPIEAELWPAERNNDYFYSNKVRDILVGLGFSDAYNYSFIGEKEIKIFDNKYTGLINLLNPLSEDKKFLRPSLLFHLLNNTHENLKHQKSIRLFELGEVFSVSKTKDIKEKKMLAGVLAYKKNKKESAESFYEIKGILDVFFQKLGISDMWLNSFEKSSIHPHCLFWHSGRAAKINIGNETIGTIGEISHLILKKMDIDTRVAAFEMDFEKIIQIINEEYDYRPISKFPAVTRDIAILTERNTKIADVQGIIEEVGGQLLIDVELFDIYEDDKTNALLPKSLAFHLIFQSQEKTLSDKEVDELMKNILKAIAENNWEVRV